MNKRTTQWEVQVSKAYVYLLVIIGLTCTYIYVIIQCELYTDLRVSLFKSATNICPNFLNKNDSDRLCFLSSNDKIFIDVARALHDILEKRRQFLYVTNLLILLCGICCLF